MRVGPVETTSHRTFWDVYRFTWRDLSAALLALPAALQILSKPLDELGLSSTLANAILTWKHWTRFCWEWLANLLPMDIRLTLGEKDALSLALLALLAALGSRLLRRGESVFVLADKAAQGKSRLTQNLHTAIFVFFTLGVMQFFVVDRNAFGWSLFAIVMLLSAAGFLFLLRFLPLKEPAPLQHDDVVRANVAEKLKDPVLRNLLTWLVAPLLVLQAIYVSFFLEVNLMTDAADIVPAMLISAICVVSVWWITASNWRAFPIIFLNALMIVVVDHLSPAVTAAVVDWGRPVVDAANEFLAQHGHPVPPDTVAP